MRLKLQLAVFSSVLSVALFGLSSFAQARTPDPANDINLLRQFAFSMDLVDAAHERLNHKVRYDGSYLEIPYPWGDVPKNMGVCTDVVIRAYRKLGIDLQERVHQDMSRSFTQYPNLPKWDRVAPDPNIDHRRVLNLRVFFAHMGAALPISHDANNYLPGDLVTWDIMPGMPHIGIVSNNISEDKKRPLIVHNIGKGPKLEDVLFSMKITGHYRYQPDRETYLSSNNQKRHPPTF